MTDGKAWRYGKLDTMLVLLGEGCARIRPGKTDIQLIKQRQAPVINKDPHDEWRAIFQSGFSHGANVESGMEVMPTNISLFG